MHGTIKGAIILAGALALGAASYIGGSSSRTVTRLEYIRLQGQADYGGIVSESPESRPYYLTRICMVGNDTIRVRLLAVGIDKQRGEIQARRIADCIRRDNPGEAWMKIETQVTVTRED